MCIHSLSHTHTPAHTSIHTHTCTLTHVHTLTRAHSHTHTHTPIDDDLKEQRCNNLTTCNDCISGGEDTVMINMFFDD